MSGKMRVTLLEPQKNSRSHYNVHIDGEYAFSLHEDVIVRHRITVGRELDEETISCLREDQQWQRAYSDSLRMIARRPLASDEVRKRLERKKYAREHIESVIAALISQNYIDDRQFAAAWTEQRIFSQQRGRQWVKQELAQKGIPKPLIREALERIDPEDEYETAFKLAAKRWRQTSGDDAARLRKLAAFLLRRGYSRQIAIEVVRKIRSANQLELEEEWFEP